MEHQHPIQDVLALDEGRLILMGDVVCEQGHLSSLDQSRDYP